MQSQCRRREIFWPGENKLHHRKARVLRDDLFAIAHLIVDRARPVWSGCEITCFCYIAGTDDRIYSVHEHDFASPWIWDVIIIASRTEFVREFVYGEPRINGNARANVS